MLCGMNSSKTGRKTSVFNGSVCTEGLLTIHSAYTWSEFYSTTIPLRFEAIVVVCSLVWYYLTWLDGNQCFG